MPIDRLDLAARAYCQREGAEFSELVGEGSFKKTYKIIGASHTQLALKIHRPGFSTERTEREIEAMALCDHPNIGRLFQVSTVAVEDETFLTTLEEFFGGGTLDKHLQNHGLLSNEQTRSIGRPLSEALEHISTHSLVHRDIKPANIIFRTGGLDPVLVDFGLVRALSRTPLTQSWLIQGPGTPLFAAPEQLNNERDLIDWRTDQFSLGVTLFLARFGFHPYGEAASGHEALVQRVADRQGPSEVARESAEQESLDLLTKMVSAWPVERFRRPSDLTGAWLNGD